MSEESGVQESGVQEFRSSGVRSSGVQESGVQESGVQESGVTGVQEFRSERPEAGERPKQALSARIAKQVQNSIGVTLM
ncbi:MAG: hypothetical protein JOZ21_09890 [Verrucomicrobia bacterium]|nr:hypothetical protein [Verrucomicrobiota bacterium]